VGRSHATGPGACNPKRPENSELMEDGQEANPLSQYITKYSKDRPENLEFIHFLRKIFDENGAVSIGEIGSAEGLESTLKLGTDYVKNGKGLHLTYTFSMLNKNMNAEYLEHVLRVTEESIEDGWPCWSLSNHDCMRMISRFDCFGKHDGFQQMMLLLLLSLRGTPIIYYGEEVDMQEYEITKDELRDPQGIRFWPDIKGRDGCRLPFPWDSKLTNQGFNSGTKPWLPAANKLSLDQAKADSGSTFHVLQEMLQIRKKFPALQNGGYRKILLDGDCFVFERKTAGETMLIAANFSTEEQSINLPYKLTKDHTPKAFKRFCTLKNELLTSPACGYFLGEK